MPPVAPVIPNHSYNLYDKRKLPKFSGAKRDFISFRRDWKSLVTGKFALDLELKEIKFAVPKEIKPDLKNLRSLEEVCVQF